ncbi:MAG TPA: 30S ribosomal protein S9 [Candidatus Thermoplasmatota archaeon]|nr:30S ribosomal protein S9 [Candidatus Thermoplasmatota archaeon]
MKVVNVSGKRKTAVARATARKGEGRIRINNTPLEIYQPELARLKVREALYIAGEDRVGKVDIDVNVQGGGIMGQAAAIRTAVARALVEFHNDESLKELYLGYDRSLLVNDTRRKEAKHELGRGARKKKQKSYR